MRKRQPRTVLELCIARAGGGLRAIPKGSRVCERLVEWSIATVQSTERDVATTVEYATYWRLSESRAWEHRAQIRELFTIEEFGELVRTMAADMRARGLTAIDGADEIAGMLQLPVAV